MLTTLLKNNQELFIISPHLDDGILSCGGMMSDLSKNHRLTIINIFTRGSKGPYTLSARKNLLNAGFTDATELYKQRVSEDREVMGKLGINVINLGLIEALFRKKTNVSFLGKIIPEISHLYPTYRFHVLGNTAKGDDSKDKIELLLKKIIPDKAIVFLPYGIAGHVDHLIVRQAGEELYKNVIYYSEFPYNYRCNDLGPKKNYEIFQFDIDNNENNKLISSYKTQLDGLFPDKKIPIHKEIFYLRKPDSLRSVIYDNLSPELERMWKNLWDISGNANFFNSPGWYKAYIETFKSDEQKIIAIFKGDKLTALIPLVREKLYGIRFYRSPGDKFAHRTSALADFKNTDILHKLKSDLAKLGNVYMSHLFYDDALLCKNAISKSNIINRTEILRMTLNLNENNELALSKKGQILKKARKVQHLLKLESFKENLNSLLDEVFKLDAKSTKAQRNYNVFSDKKNQTFFHKLAFYLKGYLVINILKLNEISVAYEIGFINKNEYIDNERAYITGQEYYTPGKVMMIKIAEVIVKENFKTFDLGPGTDNLKKSLANDSIYLSDFYLVKSPWLKSYLWGINNIRNKAYNLIFNRPKLYSVFRKTKKLFKN